MYIGSEGWISSNIKKYRRLGQCDFGIGFSVLCNGMFPKSVCYKCLYWKDDDDMEIWANEIATKYIFQLQNAKIIYKHKKVSKVSCGWNHVLFMSGDSVFSLGNNGFGQCGVSKDKDIISTPYCIESVKSVRDLSCGEHHSLVLDTLGAVYSFGSNDYGQCGVLKRQDDHTPQKMGGIDHAFIIKIECGANHSVLLEEDGNVYSTGWNSHCQLGHGDTTDYHLPEVIGNLSNDDIIIVDISAGIWHTCVLANDGKLYYFGTLCWNGEPWLEIGRAHV